MFYNHTFYILSNVITHIRNYPWREVFIALYINVVKQTSIIFDLESAFAKSLIKAIKKNKSWANVEWSINKVKQLLVFLSCHIQAARTRQIYWKKALKIINKYWGPKVIAFFRCHNKNKKTLR